MKDLILKTAERTGLVDAEQLAKFLEENNNQGRLDEALLSCPYFTEDTVLKLFAEVLGWEFLSEIPAKAVPREFVEAVPATYAQHHYLIGIRPEGDDSELTVVLSKPLDVNALDNVSKMTGLPVKAAIATRAAITAVIDVAYEQRTTVIEEVAEELDAVNGKQSLELGLIGEDLKKFDSLLSRSHGVIFVTGPTGSGKSTTLYACLNRINSAEKNVITIEDPIEYQLDGISQIQVASKKGMNFATSLRHVLRQDPDVIMVGEVRDIETARMAIQSSLTGHLVFSTLHTNDSAGAVSRLLDLGVEPYLVSSSLIAIIAQRLVRKVCPDCKEPVEPAPHELRELGLGSSGTDGNGGKFFVGRGCERCFQTGYRGRTGIYEMMLISEEIQNLIYKRETAGTIKKIALDAGMQTLRMDGARKMLAGITTVSEVLRVTQTDIM